MINKVRESLIFMSKNIGFKQWGFGWTDRGVSNSQIIGGYIERKL